MLPLVRVIEVGPAGYAVADGRRSYQVRGDPGELAVGDEAYVAGVFRAAGPSLDGSWHARAGGRTAKKVLGLLGMGLMLVGMPLWFRVTRDGIALRG